MTHIEELKVAVRSNARYTDLSFSWKDLVAEIESLEARVKELEQDKADLDWMDAQGTWYAKSDIKQWAVEAVGRSGDCKETTLRMGVRDAIRKARKEGA